MGANILGLINRVSRLLLSWIECFVRLTGRCFPNALLQSAASEDSDHCPLVLGLRDNKVTKRRFHFESFWTKIEGFHEVVQNAWSSIPDGHCPYLSLDLKFKATAKALQRWSDKKVGHINSQLELAREVLHQLEIAQDGRLLSTAERWLVSRLKKTFAGFSLSQEHYCPP
jgi:hypothetical protein